MIRQGNKWLSEKVSHLYVQQIKYRRLNLNGVHKETPQISGFPFELMLNMDTNSPVEEGGSEMYDISPDGTEVVFTGADRISEEIWNGGWKIYRVKIEDSSVIQTF